MAFQLFKKLFISLNDFKDPQDQLRIINNIQNNIEKTIDTIVSKNQNDSILLQNISLKTGDNIISHKLNKKITGWYIVRLRQPAIIYDTQDTNTQPNLTLLLTSDIDVIIDLLVF